MSFFFFFFFLSKIVVCYKSIAGFVFSSWSGCLFLCVFIGIRFLTNQIVRAVTVISYSQSNNLFLFYPSDNKPTTSSSIHQSKESKNHS